MKKIYIQLMLVLSVFAYAACDLAETNVDPASLTEANLDLVLPSASAHLAFNSGALGARNPGIVMQYFQGLEAQQLGYSQYIIPQNAMDNLWVFGMYGGGMKDMNYIITQTQGEEAQNAPYYSGIAKIMMAESLGMLTTFFGPVPYSNAFLGEEGVLQPEYDTQEQNFIDIQRLLDEAIAELSGDPGDIVPAGDEVIFGGNPDNWIATAYALKARYFVTQGRYNEAAAVLPNAIGSNAGNALYPFANSVTGANPLWSFGVPERPGTMGAHPTFITYMTGDPREELLTPNNDFVNGFWTSQDSPLPFITYWEMKFIEAEIAARAGGDAETPLEEAIRANMSFMGLSTTDINTYILRLPDATLETVITEKYKAIYPTTHVAWSDYRRNPDAIALITPNPNAVNDFYEGSVDEIPVRFIYPESEFLYNQENLNEARANFLSGGEEKLDISLPVFANQ